jgi:8-oxo-dGTP diphosphatase
MIERTGRILPTVRGVIMRNGKFLLVQRSKNDKWSPGMWEFPGGKIDFGQDINDALKREIKEETGLDISVREPLFFWDQDIKDLPKYEGFILITLYFSCEAPLNARVVLSDEHDDHKWIEYSELKEIKDQLANHTVEVMERLEKAEF